MKHLIIILFLFSTTCTALAASNTEENDSDRADRTKEIFRSTIQHAEQGNSFAQYNLGLMYIYGEGVIRDLGQAKIWLKNAYENGDKDASQLWEEYQLWKY